LTVLSFTTVGRDGNARAPGALAKLLRSKKFPETFACAEQVHGSLVQIVPKLTAAKKYPKADGLLTDAPAQPLAIFTADCVPVFMSADQGRVVGLLHAGWRGIRLKILKKAVRLLRTKWGIPARQAQIWLGPNIGPCCFEVKWDVARYFPVSRKRAKDRWRIDLGKELRAQARRLGVQFLSVKSSTRCTMHNHQFHSYRRNQTARRLASVIMKKT
jgi:YfiH family protein